MSKNTEKAFHWIIGIFKRYNVPFQISGGFAAKIYGVDRDLNDIDIGIPNKFFDVILPEVKEYVTHGPEQYKDDQWDLLLMSLKYEGQKIDIAGRDTISFFDKESDSWVPGHRDLIENETREIYGVKVPLIPVKSLIAYKTKLGRNVDVEDVRQLKALAVGN